MFLTRVFHDSKIQSLKTAMAQDEVNGFLSLDLFNLNYLTGFYHTPSERPIGLYVPLNGKSVLFVPQLEQEHAEEEWTGKLCVYQEFPGKVNPLLWMCEQIPVRKLGVDNVSSMRFQTIRSVKPQAEVSDYIGKMRLSKEPSEIAFVVQAAKYADFAVASARAAITKRCKEDITEREVVEHLKYETLKKMQQDYEDHPDYPLSCAATVHAGERGAFPHGLPSGRRIEVGDTVIVGVGAAVAGYHAESACTFVIGEPTREQKLWMNTAIAIRNISIEELKPGVPCGHVDDLHLKLVEDAGLAAFTRHRLGHGMGLQNHEPPWIQSGDRRPLVSGMVVSSEPGIYVPGKGGIRLIDTFVITDDGNRLASQYMAEHLDNYVIPV